MSDAALFADLERLLTGREAAVVGCADLRVLPARMRDGLPVGVCIGVELTPTAYAGEYDRANALLRRLVVECASFLRERGYRATGCEPTTSIKDNKTLSTVLPHKTVATLAGLGWIGKCALLVSETHGSAVRYNTVLTDAPLPVGAPVV